MTTTAFTVLFLPACLAVPAGLALGAVAEFLIEKAGAVLASASEARARADARRELGRRGLRSGPIPHERLDEMALLNPRRSVGASPWM